MFCRLFWFRLNQELSVKTNFLSVIYSHAEQTSNVILFKTHVCIQQFFVTFTTAPEYIVASAQTFTNFQTFLHLCCCMCENISVRCRTCTVHITWVSEHVSCIPQQFLAGSLHALFKDINDGVDIAVEFTQRCAFWCDVHIMEAEVRQIHLVHKFKSCFCTSLSFVQTVQFIPATNCSFSAKRIGTASS
ncbi:hypothetical protein D3C76_933450 [compost metagenome]